MRSVVSMTACPVSMSCEHVGHHGVAIPALRA